MAEELMLTIIVKGNNVMGDSLCEMHGFLFGGKKLKKIEYSGPVVSARVVAYAIQDLFTEKEG